ncbi:MAG: TIGR02147 family protein [Bacteriovoracaceae bacterium]
MKKTTFDYKHYKEFLRDSLEARGQERGIRSRLAEAVSCHTAYVSQVLNGHAHFSLEQAELITRFLNLNSEETQFFLLLVQYDRAGTPNLKIHFEKQLQEIKNKQLILKDRLEFKRTLSREDQATFYSSWHYGAIHVLVSVPGCHTERGIAEYLNLPLAKVVDVLNFLVSVGLVTKSEGRYSIGTSHIHLEHDSPMISKHHSNWRMKAIQSLDHVKTNDLHYSSVITCSLEDSQKIKTVLIQAIDEVRAIVKPSKDEGGFVYCLDFFGLRDH